MTTPRFSTAPPAERVTSLARSVWADVRAASTFASVADDARSGASVALAALPITLGVALASDVSPGPALVAAIIGGFVASTLGSLPVVITAPAAALAVLTGSIADRHGLPGVLIVTLVAGLTQLLLGMTSFARLARLVPQSVLHGFDVGLGVLLLVGQLPRMLGLEAPDESHVFDVVTHIGSYARSVSPTAVGIGLFALLCMLFLPRAVPAIPAAFIAVAAPTAMVAPFPPSRGGTPVAPRRPGGGSPWTARSSRKVSGTSLRVWPAASPSPRCPSAPSSQWRPAARPVARVGSLRSSSWRSRCSSCPSRRESPSRRWAAWSSRSRCACSG